MPSVRKVKTATAGLTLRVSESRAKPRLSYAERETTDDKPSAIMLAWIAEVRRKKTKG